MNSEIIKKILPYIITALLVIPAAVGGNLDWSDALKKIFNPKAAVVDCTATLEGQPAANVVEKQIEAGTVDPKDAIKE